MTLDATVLLLARARHLVEAARAANARYVVPSGLSLLVGFVRYENTAESKEVRDQSRGSSGCIDAPSARRRSMSLPRVAHISSIVNGAG